MGRARAQSRMEIVNSYLRHSRFVLLREKYLAPSRSRSGAPRRAPRLAQPVLRTAVGNLLFRRKRSAGDISWQERVERPRKVANFWQWPRVPGERYARVYPKYNGNRSYKTSPPRLIVPGKDFRSFSSSTSFRRSPSFPYANVPWSGSGLRGRRGGRCWGIRGAMKRHRNGPERPLKLAR